MKKTLTLLLILTIGLAATAQTKAKSKMIKPTGNQKRVTLLVSGKTSQYYALSHENASVIRVEGPGKLRVITRAFFKPEQKSKLDYEISYVVDGGIPNKVKITGSVRAESSTYVEDRKGLPGIGKEIEILLGRGSHTIEFLLTNNLVQVDARFLFTETKGKKMDWVAFSPMTPSEPVELVSKEETTKYFRFSNEKPLIVEINGPTELRVFTRIENHFNMKGRINYRVLVSKAGKVLNTYQLSSTHSDVTTYKENSSLVPGKACEFVIEVPKGKHVYEIKPLDQDKNTVLGRFLIPLKDVKLGN